MIANKTYKIAKVVIFSLSILILGIYLFAEITLNDFNTNAVSEEVDPLLSEDCKDDDGINYFVFGQTEGITLLNSTPGVYFDECFSQNDLVEYYCRDNYVEEILYDCSTEGKICEGGVCLIQEAMSFCNDSDDGNDYELKGTVYGQIALHLPFEFKEDFCNSTNLTEYYCGPDDLVKQEVVLCDEYMEDGICNLGICTSVGDSPDVNCSSVGGLCVNNASMCTGNLVNYSCDGDNVCCTSNLNAPSNFDCESFGYSCVESSFCANELSAYSCDGDKVCCGEESPPSNTESTCESLNGMVCTLSQTCSGGQSYLSPDLDEGQVCCVGGLCQIKETTIDNQCNLIGGVCKENSCAKNEVLQSSYVCNFNQVCCSSKSAVKSQQNYWWIWVIGIIIVISALGFLVLKIRQRLKAVRKPVGEHPVQKNFN